MEQPDVKEFHIPSSHMPALEERFAALEKKAFKLGCEVPYFQIGETYTRSYDYHPLTGAYFVAPLIVEYTTVLVVGEVLKIAGWSFVATIEHLPEGNLVRSVPGFEIDVKYRTERPTCDHCRSVRKRKNTYVVRHESGHEKRVGSTCVGDFLGHDSPDQVASQLEAYFRLFRELRDLEHNFTNVEFRMPLLSFLAVTACMVRNFGWVSKAACENDPMKTPTSQHVLTYLNDEGKSGKELRRECSIGPQDRIVAESALQWAKDITDLTSDYLYNINTVSKMESIEWKHAGLAASIVGSYLREVERRNLERARREANAASEWIGTEKQRIEIVARVISVKSLDDRGFGVTYCCKFIANGRDHLTWFASSPPDFAEHMMVHLKVTIKGHDEYHGVKQTLITRCKVINTWDADSELTTPGE